MAVLCSVPCIAGVLYNKGIAIGKIPPVFEKIVVVIIALLLLYWFLSAAIGWITYLKKKKMRNRFQKLFGGNRIGLILLIAFIFPLLSSCEKEVITGIEYNNITDLKIKVTVYYLEDESILNLEMHQISYSDLTLLATFIMEPHTIFFQNLSPGFIKTEYTPEGCWRVLPDIITLDAGEIRKDSLWFTLSLWDE